ncbi:MAG: nucleoside monophosphate kinase [Clostridiales bacterium]|jgi:adenylate kinase family enzyme|nr:nucleoside monophosphate kinase [Clostridiales bacterium]
MKQLENGGTTMEGEGKILAKWDYILLLGESGSGKGTLVKNIRRFWLPNLTSASMGDIFRERAKTDPEIKRLTEQGELINDETACKVFADFALTHKPGLMDGFPRNRQQAINLIKFIKEKRWRVLVIDISCNVEVILERLLSRRRADDELHIVYKRNLDHKTLHPSVMEEIKHRADLFDIIHLDGNFDDEIVLSSFMLSLLRLVDMLYFYDLKRVETSFEVSEDEFTINPAINRWISGFLNSLQAKIDSETN